MGLGMDSWSKPPTPSQPIVNEPPKAVTQTNQQPATTDQRGTDQTPFIVKILEPQKAETETARDQEERDNKSSSDWWLVKLTAVLAATGILQFFVFGYQALQLRRTVTAMKEAGKTQSDDMKKSIVALETAAKASKKSADTMNAAERAYVFVAVKMPNENIQHSEGGTIQTRFPVKYRNQGKTPAVVSEIRAMIKLIPISDDYPESIGEIAIDQLIPPGIAIGPSSMLWIQVWTNLKSSELAEINGGNVRLLCLGCVTYRDIHREDRKTGFCWEYNPSAKRFVIAPTAKLNYYT
jgi:hypothetical protein